MDFSPLIVGTMRWGIWGADHPVREVQRLIETAFAENLTSFDHADIYGDYTTEQLFGEAFSGMKIPREKVQFISKCGIERPGANRNFTLKSYNYSRSHILKSVEQSLINLRTDYLDVLLLHRPSPLMNPEEIAETFSILREQDKVLHFGVSNFSASQFDLINDAFPLMTNQIEISINNTDSFFDGTLDQMMRYKLRPMAWSVLGNYFTQETPENRRIKTVLQVLCEQYNADESRILIAFLLKHPARILPIVGTSRAETLKKLVLSSKINLQHTDWFKLLEAKAGRPVP